MTRAIRIATAAISGLAIFNVTLQLAAQNNQPTAAGQQQPRQASVYGPPLGGPAPVRQGPAVQAQFRQVQAGPDEQVQQQNPQQGQLLPAAGQGPIRQPANGVAGPAVPNGLDVPKVQVVPPRPSPLQPDWYPLDPKVQTWVDQVLAYWEKRSDQVKTLECTFQKWEYDPQYVPNIVQQLQVQGKLHEMPFTKYASGVIKYAAPDKGLFRVEQLQAIDGGQPGQKPKYNAQPKENGEHWVSDGKRVFAFDAKNKEVLESQLPPEMQGKALADGPLPFLFGARAETIKARYWIRPLQAEAAGEYCLEAVPKSQQDAANFKMVQVVLDEKEYLPTKMQIFERDWSPSNPHRTAYKFDKRIVNEPQNVVPAALNPLKIANPWHREFYEVKIPSGWRHIIRDANGNTVSPGNTAKVPIVPFGPRKE
jgi:TIGR03009 family protein